MLDWRTIEYANREQRSIKGTELEYCFPDGFLCRFKIVSVRTIDWRNDATALMGGYLEYDCKYRVYDADTITDAEIRKGFKPKSIGDFATLDEALQFIEPHRYTTE